MADLKSKQIKFPLTGTSVVSSSAQIATDISGSFVAPSASFSTRVTTEEGNVDTLQARDLIAGAGLTGGGTLAADRTFAVGAGTGVTVNTNDVAIGQAVATTSNVKFNHITGSGNISGSSLLGIVGTATQGTIDIHSLSGYVANENIDHTSVSITAGAGLTGGGTIASTRDIAVGAGIGVTVNANDVAIGQAVSTTSNVQFANITGSNISGSSLLGVVGTATQATIDHDSLANFVANEHIDHSSVSVVAGAGLTGGGTIAANRTINVVGGTGITANANEITTTDGEIVHDSLSGFVANEHIDHSGVSVTAGTGLTGGGTIAATRTLNVIGGDGITANANDIAITAAQTTITSLLATDIKIGEDNETKIDFETPNEIHLYAANAEQVYVADGILGPETDSDVDLGTTGVRFKDAFVDSVTTTGNVAAATITTTGNITAQGDIIAENYIVSSSVTHMTSSAISGSSLFGDTQDDTHQFTGSVFVTGSTFNIHADGGVSSSASGSFLNATITDNISATNLYGTVLTATQATIDHDSLANFVADEHVVHGDVSVIAGTGLTGGGTIAANRTLNVIGGDGITANANDIAITPAQTTITSVFAEDLKIGEDDETKIDFETANQINFYGNNVKLLELSNANSGDAVFNVATADKNFTIKGTDGSTGITALDIDMATNGNTQFLGNISGSQIEASGDMIAFGSSDKRLKDNITPIENPLEKMEKIGGYTFIWNDKQSTYKGKDVGVVAQEIQSVLPEIVAGRANGYLGVKYEKIVPLLIESIKENTKQIKELKQEINEIKENCDCLNK